MGRLVQSLNIEPKRVTALVLKDANEIDDSLLQPWNIWYRLVVVPVVIILLISVLESEVRLVQFKNIALHVNTEEKLGRVIPSSVSFEHP